MTLERRATRHINRKRVRLLGKLTALPKGQVLILAAPKGACVPGSPDFNPQALYVSLETLIDLVENPPLLLPEAENTKLE